MGRGGVERPHRRPGGCGETPPVTGGVWRDLTGTPPFPALKSGSHLLSGEFGAGGSGHWGRGANTPVMSLNDEKQS